jgi:hypothetical protein
MIFFSPLLKSHQKKTAKMVSPGEQAEIYLVLKPMFYLPLQAFK